MNVLQLVAEVERQTPTQRKIEVRQRNVTGWASFDGKALVQDGVHVPFDPFTVEAVKLDGKEHRLHEAESNPDGEPVILVKN